MTNDGSSVGLTQRMSDALAAITAYVALHGSMPSRRALAAAMGCKPTNAHWFITSLIERGELNSVTPGGVLSGFGRDGVCVFVPPHVAAQLAAFCLANSEKIGAVVADAITLHIDQIESGGGATAEMDGAEA